MLKRFADDRLRFAEREARPNNDLDHFSVSGER
jgi:hypothetical protein